MTAKKRTSSFYSYSSKRSLRQEEIAAYRRIALATIIVLAIIVGGFFLGVPILANLGNTGSNQNLQLGSTDSISPAPPTINSIPDHTNQGTISITGTAESGATIEVKVNDQEGFSTIVDGQGLFEGELTLTSGSNTIIAVATDAAGNQSQPSREIVTSYDATPPSLVLLANIPESTDTSPYTISAKTEPNAVATINERRAIVNADGIFSTSLTLKAGDNPISIIVTDQAGNQNSIKRSITYTDKSKSTPPNNQPTPTPKADKSED